MIGFLYQWPLYSWAVSCQKKRGFTEWIKSAKASTYSDYCNTLIFTYRFYFRSTATNVSVYSIFSDRLKSRVSYTTFPRRFLGR